MTLFDASQAYQELMKYRYVFLLGHKGIAETLTLEFTKEAFHHLAGLHKIGIARIRNKKYALSLIAFDRTKRTNWYNEVPGTKYRYSNYGAGIIGSIIESITGNNIDDNLQENVFYPLNISASYSAGLLPDSENVATLYNTDGKIDKSREDSLGKVWDMFADH